MLSQFALSNCSKLVPNKFTLTNQLKVHKLSQLKIKLLYNITQYLNPETSGQVFLTLLEILEPSTFIHTFN